MDYIYCRYRTCIEGEVLRRGELPHCIVHALLSIVVAAGDLGAGCVAPGAQKGDEVAVQQLSQGHVRDLRSPAEGEARERIQHNVSNNKADIA